MNDVWNRTNYTNKNSGGQDRLKQQTKVTIGIYFFFGVLVVAFTLVLIR